MNKLEYTTQNKMLPNLLTVLQPKAPRLLIIIGLLTRIGHLTVKVDKSL